MSMVNDRLISGYTILRKTVFGYNWSIGVNSLMMEHFPTSAMPQFGLSLQQYPLYLRRVYAMNSRLIGRYRIYGVP